MKIAILFASALMGGMAWAQMESPGAIASGSSDSASSTNADAGMSPAPAAQTETPKPAKRKSLTTSAQLQAALDQLTQTNKDLLDLLKQQQAVLQDLQFDRRLQSRQIESLEERLTDSALHDAELEKQVALLEAAAGRPQPPVVAAPAPAPATNPAVAPAPDNGANPGATTNAAPEQTADNPPPPQSYLPAAPEPVNGTGTMSWHRLFSLKGDKGQQSDLFHIDGKSWRVVWHNQDKPGKTYANTSALFISAFPKDDTIPQQVCAKLGSGGDATELLGPGNYYLKIEASGGSWELAVEDFR